MLMLRRSWGGVSEDESGPHSSMPNSSTKVRPQYITEVGPCILPTFPGLLPAEFWYCPAEFSKIPGEIGLSTVPRL
jgi:hypothetical protein